MTGDAQDPQPTPVGPIDEVLGVGRWPATTVGYGTTPGHPPTIDVELRVEVERCVEADRDTWARIVDQLDAVDADGTSLVTITVASSLDGGAAHVLTGPDDAAVRGVARAAQQHLDAVLAGTDAVRAGPDPIGATVSIPVEATNPAAAFPLEVTLTLARPPAPYATVTVPPRPADPLATFAAAFAEAFTTDDVVLRVGVRESEAQPLWVARTGATPRSGAFGCEVTGPAAFWAPRPLSTVLLSRPDVPIWPFDPDAVDEPPLDPSTPERQAFAGIDLDVWAAEALAAIDAFLAPRGYAPALVLDAAGAPGHRRRLTAARAALARAIAASVEEVLTSPTPADQAAVDDARAAWERQLLVTLASASTAAVAVQLPVTLSGPTDDGAAPTFHGHPVGTALPVALSPFTVAGTGGQGHLTFLVTAPEPGARPSVVLDLGYPVDRIEIDATTALTFPHPQPVIPPTGAVEVPIVLRTHPDPPAPLAQADRQTLDPTSAATLLATALQWTHVARYRTRPVAQDVTTVTTTVEPAPVATGPETPSPDDDLFAPLARLVTALPALRSVFDTDLARLTPATEPSDPTFRRAARAVEAFTTLVTDVAARWAPIPAPEVAETAEAGDAGTGRSVTVAIAEGRHPSGPEAGGPDDLLVTVTPAPGSPLPADLPQPEPTFAGHVPVPTAGGVRYQDPTTQALLSWDAAQAMGERTVETGPLDVLDVEAARTGLQIVRNAELVAGRPTRAGFVHRTSPVGFPSAYGPLLSVDDLIDVAALATGAPVARTLVEQLRALFGAVFAAARPGAVATIQLRIGYREELETDLPDGGGPVTVVPIALVPPTPFVVPDDAAFVDGVAATIREWIDATEPPVDGELAFELVVDAATGSMPLVRLSGLTLRRTDITDL